MNASLPIPKGGVRLILTLAEDGHFEVEYASSDDYGLQAFMLHRALDSLHFNAFVEAKLTHDAGVEAEKH